MAGLDSILNEITRDAQGEATQILEDAKIQVKSLQDEATQVIEEELKLFDLETERLCQLQKEKGLSQAESAKKRAILSGRQGWIEQMLHQSKDYLVSLPAEAYFDILKELCINHAHQEDGQIHFSSKDVSRIPEGFLELLNQELKSKNKGALTQGETKAHILGGCILSYQNIEENLTFDALFEEHHETLEDRVVKFIPSIDIEG